MSLGKKFNIRKTKICKNNKVDLIKSVESNLHKIPKQHRNEVRLNLVHNIQNNLNKQKKMKHISHFEREIKIISS